MDPSSCGDVLLCLFMLQKATISAVRRVIKPDKKINEASKKRINKKNLPGASPVLHKCITSAHKCSHAHTYATHHATQMLHKCFTSASQVLSRPYTRHTPRHTSALTRQHRVFATST